MTTLLRSARPPRWFRDLLTLSILATLPAHAAESLPVASLDRAEPVDFHREVLPFLRQNCLACHNETKAKANLILESPEAMRKGGDSGPSLIPGDATASLLFTTAAHLEEPTMPPAKNSSNARNLNPEELALLRLWIDQGAPGIDSSLAAAPKDWVLQSQTSLYSLAFSPDGRFLASGRGHTVQIYDLFLERLTTHLVDPDLPGIAHRDFVHSLAFSPGGTLASGGYRILKLWHRPDSLPIPLDPAEELAAPPLPEEIVKLRPQLDLLPTITRDLQRLPGEEAMAKRLSTHYAQEIPKLEEAWKAEATAAETAAQEIPGHRRTQASLESTLRDQQTALAVAQAQALPEDALTKLRQELEETRNALLAAQRAASQALRNRDLAAQLTGEAAQKVAASKAAHAMATAALAGIQSCREDLEKRRAGETPKLEVAGGALLDDGAVAAVALKSGTVHLYATASGRHLESFSTGGEIAGLELSPDGLIITAPSLQRTLWKFDRPWAIQGRLGDANDPKIIQDRVLALAFSPDGARLASGTGVPSRNGILQIWDPFAGTELARNAESHSDTITSLAFSPQGDFLVTGAADQFAKIFDSATAEPLRSLEAHTGHVLGVAWSHDERRIATSGADSEVKLWDAATGEQITTLKGWKKEVTAVSFLSPANERVLAASGDGTLKLDTTPLPGAAGFLHAAAVSPDGQWIAAGGQDGTLRVWSATDLKLVHSFPAPQLQLAQESTQP